MKISKNIADMLRLRAEISPDKEGLVFQDTRWTWGQVFEHAQQVASALKAAGIQRGDIVGVLAPHSPAQVVSIFGIALADAAFSLINPLLKPAQMRHQLMDAAMAAVIGHADHRESLALGSFEGMVHWLDIELDGTLKPDIERLSEPPAGTRNIPADVANIIYTSGSTGRPKGVVVPHRTLLDGARIVSSYLGITEQDRTLSILPLGFDYGLNQLLTAVFTGATVVMHSYAMPLDLIRILEREKITGMAAVPAIWPGLLAQLKRRKTQVDLPHLRYITTAGGAHAPELLRQLDDTFSGTEIIIMYGLTESFRSTYLPYSEVHRRPGCVGRPVPEVEILVIDDDGNPCPPGVKGELVHRGAFVTYGYLNNPELTAHRFIDLPGPGPGCLPEKAVRSGDLVSLSEDGFVYFHGRMDSQIKSRGYRISPDEVAEAIMRLEAIRQVAVFGVPDADLGQRVVAAYETQQGAELDPRDLVQQLGESLPSYAFPKAFKFFEKLPVTANGKLDVTGIRREYEALEAEPVR